MTYESAHDLPRRWSRIRGELHRGVPLADMTKVYENIESVLHLQISEEQKSNADSVYDLVRYGVAGGSEGWIPGADVPFISADGFCSPIGSGWESRVTSEFGSRIDPISHRLKNHTGMDMAVPHGYATPCRAAGNGDDLQVQCRWVWLLCHDRPRQRACHIVWTLLEPSGAGRSDGGGRRLIAPLRQHRPLHRPAPSF